MPPQSQVARTRAYTRPTSGQEIEPTRRTASPSEEPFPEEQAIHEPSPPTSGREEPTRRRQEQHTEPRAADARRAGLVLTPPVPVLSAPSGVLAPRAPSRRRSQSRNRSASLRSQSRNRSQSRGREPGQRYRRDHRPESRKSCEIPPPPPPWTLLGPRRAAHPPLGHLVLGPK